MRFKEALERIEIMIGLMGDNKDTEQSRITLRVATNLLRNKIRENELMYGRFPIE